MKLLPKFGQVLLAPAGPEIIDVYRVCVCAAHGMHGVALVGGRRVAVRYVPGSVSLWEISQSAQTPAASAKASITAAAAAKASASAANAEVRAEPEPWRTAAPSVRGASPWREGAHPASLRRR